MSIAIITSDDKKTVVIKIIGRFDFSLHGEFRKAYKDSGLKVEQFVVDLSEADYLDSSALGMLLLLKEYAENNSSRVKIINISNDIREIFNIASFDKLFLLE